MAKLNLDASQALETAEQQLSTAQNALTDIHQVNKAASASPTAVTAHLIAVDTDTRRVTQARSFIDKAGQLAARLFNNPEKSSESTVAVRAYRLDSDRPDVKDRQACILSATATDQSSAEPSTNFQLVSRNGKKFIAFEVSDATAKKLKPGEEVLFDVKDHSLPKQPTTYSAESLKVADVEPGQSGKPARVLFSAETPSLALDAALQAAEIQHTAALRKTQVLQSDKELQTDVLFAEKKIEPREQPYVAVVRRRPGGSIR